MRSLIKRVLFGSELPQEYVCVPRTLHDVPGLFVKGSNEDFFQAHVMLGYKPLVFGFEKNLGSVIQLEIRQESRVLAMIEMHRGASMQGLNTYVGKDSELQLNGHWQQFWQELREKRKNKGPSNIDLNTSLYKQVIAAYVLPRVIAMVRVQKDDLVNEFPTDLHGEFGTDLYTSSLRTGGAACAQLMETKRSKLFSMPLGSYRAVYEAGKNHNKPWTNRKGADSFLEQEALSCIDLEVIEHLDIGIHRIFIYRIIGRTHLNNGPAELAHCHREYLQWRLRNDMPTNYVLR